MNLSFKPSFWLHFIWILIFLVWFSRFLSKSSLNFKYIIIFELCWNLRKLEKKYGGDLGLFWVISDLQMLIDCITFSFSFELFSWSYLLFWCLVTGCWASAMRISIFWYLKQPFFAGLRGQLLLHAFSCTPKFWRWSPISGHTVAESTAVTWFWNNTLPTTSTSPRSIY